MPKSQINCPVFSMSPSEPAFFGNPYLTYDNIRSLGPLVFWTEYDFPVTARYDLVSALLRDRRFGRDVTHVTSPEALGWPPPAEHVKPFYDFEKSSMLECEPPVHTRLRGLVNRAFVSRAIDQLRPRIEALCTNLIDGFVRDGRCDLLAAYATPIPVIVIAELLGLPANDASLLLDWSHRMVAMYQFGRTRAIEDAAVAATHEFAAYVRAHVAARRRRPAADLISSLIVAKDQSDRLNDEELVTTVILLMNAGHEATVHAVANGIKLLLELRRQDRDDFETMAAMLQTPAGAAAIAEETLRLDPPLHLFTRYALEDLEIHGQAFATGDKIGLLLGAANHDQAVYETPARFDPARYLGPKPAPQPMSFGFGIHFCVGAPLARLELQIALPTLFDKLPDLRLEDEPSYRDSFHFHGLSRLNVRWNG